MGKIPDYVGILTRWQSTCAKDKYMFGLGMTLAFRCFFMKNKGVFDDGRGLLTSEIERGLMGITEAEAKLILEGDSELWHWTGEKLHIDLYSKELQASMEAKSKAARKAGKASAHVRWGKTLENKAENNDVKTDVITDVVTKKERKDFPTENLSNGGGSTEVAPRSFDESTSAQNSKLCSEEETAAFFEKLREFVDAPENGDEQPEKSETGAAEAQKRAEYP